ncbi:hypothetical protein ACIRPH_31705 [Nocardiopsis sp. NPDC101807]|uniref:hypothetical protein n=1 Tax=Nocardiopsis sp. NPDC101807 TaxID=3364339 RepID=UPI0037F1C15B
MRWPWKTETEELAAAAAPTPTPPPAPAPPVAEPAPAAAVVEPEHDQEENVVPAAPPSGGIDLTRVIASIVTAASAVFTVWSVWDLARGFGEEGHAAPHAVGIGAGVGVEAVWLWLLAIEWQQASTTGRVSKALTRTGWALAVGASVVLVVHGVVTSWPMVLLAVLPLAAKAGWHHLTSARAEQTRARLAVEAAAARAAAEAERQKAEDARRAQEAEQARQAARSTTLTEAQEAELAELRRTAAFVTAKTDAELELDAARAHADQQRALADIRRRAEQQMTVDEASADIEVRRAELQNRIHLAKPLYTVREITPGGQHVVPDDPSGFGLPPVSGTTGSGFGFAPQAQAHAGGASPADLRVPPHASPTASPDAPLGASPVEVDLPVPQRLLAYIAEHGDASTVKGAARELDVDPRTVRRYRDDMSGTHDMSALYSTQ